MRILCITDKPHNEEETSLKGVFEKYLLEYAEVHCVYFTKDSKKQFSWPFLNAKIFWISFCQKSQLGMILDTGCGLVS